MADPFAFFVDRMADTFPFTPFVQQATRFQQSISKPHVSPPEQLAPYFQQSISLGSPFLQRVFMADSVPLAIMNPIRQRYSHYEQGVVAIKRLKRKTKIAAASVVLVLATIGTVTYKLADRYLIEHVEVRVASAQAASATLNSAAGSNASTPGGASASSNASSASNTSTAGNASTTTNASASSAAGSSDSAAASTGTVRSDDWNYESDNEKISIQKVQKGSGNDQITYYVADVILKNSTSLQTAFAKDAFGANITQNTSTIAATHGAVFAINGDYYGFRDDGVVIRNGTLYRDEPAREGLAVLSDGTMKSYDERSKTSAELLAEGVTNTFSFGPALVQNGVAVDDFSNVKIDTNFGNRTIDSANPRTGIGMIAPNHFVFVVVDGRQTDSRGMTLNEFAGLFADLGATEAYNLDGGGSSTMYFMGRVVNKPQGKNKERGVSDIVYLPG